MTGKLIAGWFGDVGIKVNLEVMDEATLRRPHAQLRGRHVHPRLRHVPVGLVPGLRPRLDAELLHQEPDRELERLLLVGPGVRAALRPAGPGARPGQAQGDTSTGCSRSSTSRRRTSSPTTRPDFEAYNTSKWEGYIAIPDPNGNTLLPPFGNGGYANFLSIGPKTATAAEESGGGANVTIAIDRRRGGRHHRHRADRAPAAPEGDGGVT